MIRNLEDGIVRNKRGRVAVGTESEVSHVQNRWIPAELLKRPLVFPGPLEGILLIHGHGVNVLLGNGSVPQETLVEMGQVAVGITFGCDAFVDLEDMDA